MPRFFLDVLHGRRVCKDPEGQDFIDLDAARAEAVASAQYLVAHGILRNEDVSDRSFLIRDEDEQTVATVPFRDNLPGTLSGGPLSGADQLASLGPGLERLVSEHAKALGKGERYVRDVIEALPAAIYMTDAQGRITYYNEPPWHSQAAVPRWVKIGGASPGACTSRMARCCRMIGARWPSL